MRSIKKKLILFFTAILAVVVCTICILGYSKCSSYLENLAIENINNKLISDSNAFKSYIKYEHEALSLENDNLVDSKGLNIAWSSTVVNKTYSDLDDLATVFIKKGDEFIRVLTNIKDEDGSRAKGSSLNKESEAYKALANGESYSGSATILNGNYQATYELLKDKNGKVIGAYELAVPTDSITTLINVSKKNLRTLFITLSLIFFVISEICIILISRYLTNNLIVITKYFKHLENLDFSHDLPDKTLRLKDEIGDIAKAINNVVNNLRSFMMGANGLASNVTDYSINLTENMDNVNITATEISTIITQISNGASTQAKDTESGAFRVSNLSQCIDSNNDNVSELNNAMADVEKYKNDGMDILTSLEKQNTKSTRAVNTISDVILDTNIKTKQINESSEMIKDIAEQTNLLALNAAIEAARAGEDGKGFAVVAEEIRKLAEQSNSFAEEIRNVINELTKKSDVAVETVNTLKDTMDIQDNMVQVTAEKFNGISLSISKAISVLKALNSSNNLMKEEKNTIISIVENLSAIAEENAAATEEVAASVEEQTSSIYNFNEYLSELTDLAKTLQDNISKFKIGNK